MEGMICNALRSLHARAGFEQGNEFSPATPFLGLCLRKPRFGGAFCFRRAELPGPGLGRHHALPVARAVVRGAI